MEELIEELKKDVIEALNLKGIITNQLDEDEPFLESSFSLDSIDILELVVMLKRKYGIIIPDLKSAKEILHSVSSMAKYVAQNRSKKSNNSEKREEYLK